MTYHEIRRLLVFFAVIILLLFVSDNGPAQNNVQVTAGQVNQVLGVQKDLHNYYVAGKNTVIRAILSEPITINALETKVQVYKNGLYLFDIAPKTTAQATSTVDFLCKNLSQCQNWADGTYNFNIYVNGIMRPIGSYSFTAGEPLRILAVPIKANYGSGGPKSITDDGWKTLGNFMQDVYPLADGNLKWTNRLQVFDASASRYNLEKSDWSGCNKLTNALAAMIPASCKTNPKGAGCYDFVVGMIPSSLTQDNGLGLAGWAPFGDPVVVVVAGDNDAAATVAHEIAHKFGIGDTYDGEGTSSIRCTVNPAPNGFKGRNWDNNFVDFNGCVAGRPASTLTDMYNRPINGAQISAFAYPYEVTGRGALPEMADFMSAGGPWQTQLWITQDSYDWLYRRLVLHDVNTMSNTPISRNNDVAERFVSFSGSVSKSGEVELDPWQSYMDTATVSDTTGDYMVEAVDGTVNILASTAFTVTFFMVHPPRDLDWADFEGVIRFPAGTVKFRIIKNGQVLAELEVSDNEPAVGNVTPRSAATISGLYTITWTANDPDGGSLTYTVAYNPDVTNENSPWIILVDELEERVWEQDFSFLPGGTHAKVRVTASDGILSTSAESAEFIVPFKPPEIFIDELAWGTVYRTGADVLLTAEVSNGQDEEVAEDSITWTSNLSGDLGTGSELLVKNLPEGKHTITATATNSAALQAMDSVTVVVTDSYGGGEGSCFIATAAFGSYLHPSVKILRNFRDTFLLKNKAGISFVRWYYRISPSLAGLISGSEGLKAIVRVTLLPVVGFSALALHVGLIQAIILCFAFVAFLIVLIRRGFIFFRRTPQRGV